MIAQTQEDLQVKIEKLTPKAGDLIIVSLPDDVSPTQVDSLMKKLAEIKEDMQLKATFICIPERVKIEMLPGKKRLDDLENRMYEVEHELGAIEYLVNDIENQSAAKNRADIIDARAEAIGATIEQLRIK